jgi:hypothetical protein
MDIAIQYETSDLRTKLTVKNTFKPLLHCEEARRIANHPPLLCTTVENRDCFVEPSSQSHDELTEQKKKQKRRKQAHNVHDCIFSSGGVRIDIWGGSGGD